jgi:hypothetical protein
VLFHAIQVKWSRPVFDTEHKKALNTHTFISI